jgi:hypothetical protein
VAIDEAKILTKLLPSRITPSNLSGLSSSFKTFIAPLCPSLALCFRRYLLIAIIPVSELENRAERTSIKTKMAKRIEIDKLFKVNVFNS